MFSKFCKVPIKWIKDFRWGHLIFYSDNGSIRLIKSEIWWITLIKNRFLWNKKKYLSFLNMARVWEKTRWKALEFLLLYPNNILSHPQWKGIIRFCSKLNRVPCQRFPSPLYVKLLIAETFIDIPCCKIFLQSFLGLCMLDWFQK